MVILKIDVPGDPNIFRHYSISVTGRIQGITTRCKSYPGAQTLNGALGDAEITMLAKYGFSRR
jgi:hypothetical protein